MVEHGIAIATKLEIAFTTCQEKLPETLRSLNKGRASGGSIVPRWLEPAPMLLACVLQETLPKITCALHLSNVQRLRFEKWETTNELTTETRIYNVTKTRNLYTVLSQTPKKVKEALGKFANGGVIIWAPEDQQQIGKIVNALVKLHED